MKERQIIFSAPMVRAILEGRKTQTRRVVDARWQHFASACQLPESVDTERGEMTFPGRDSGSFLFHYGIPLRDGAWQPVRCPYGQPGDRLWVREAFRLCADADSIPPRETDAGYRVWYEAAAPHQPGFGKLRPGMFMPRWASRITLEIVSVRVERLQDMEGQAPYEGECDALAEGVNSIHHGDGCYYYSAFRDEPHPKNWCDPTDAFRELWESINGPGSWDANPWVWVIEFKAVTP